MNDWKLFVGKDRTAVFKVPGGLIEVSCDEDGTLNLNTASGRLIVLGGGGVNAAKVALIPTRLEASFKFLVRGGFPVVEAIDDLTGTINRFEELEAEDDELRNYVPGTDLL